MTKVTLHFEFKIDDKGDLYQDIATLINAAQEVADVKRVDIEPDVETNKAIPDPNPNYDFTHPLRDRQTNSDPFGFQPWINLASNAVADKVRRAFEDERKRRGPGAY